MKIYPKAATLPGKEGATTYKMFDYTYNKYFIPFTPKIWIAIHLTVYHTFIIMLVLKIWCQNQNKYPF